MGVTPPSLAEPVTSVPPSVEVEDGTPASVRARLPYVCDRPLLTISLRDFETRKQEIGAQLVAAGRDVGCERTTPGNGPSPWSRSRAHGRRGRRHASLLLACRCSLTTSFPPTLRPTRSFFYVVDALSDADVEEAFELAAWYHALPSAVKRGPKIDASNSLNTLGYVEESVGDGSLREALLVGWSHTPASA